MGFVQRIQCDVFKTFSKIAQYEIIVRRVGDLDGVPVQTWNAYLSRRALRRAIHFIERGMTLSHRKKVENDEENAIVTPKLRSPVL